MKQVLLMYLVLITCIGTYAQEPHRLPEYTGLWLFLPLPQNRKLHPTQYFFQLQAGQQKQSHLVSSEQIL